MIRHDEACDANPRIDSLVVEWTNSVNSELPTPVVVRDPQTAVDQCLSDLLHVYALEEPDSQPSEGGSEQPWSFPGTHPLSLESLVKRAHEGLGHPSKDRFLRILKYSKASDAVLKIAEKLKRSVCERFARPKPSRQGAPPREIGLNDMVGVDSVQIRVPFSQKKKFCLNVIDYHSHFQLMIPLADHTARAARQGYRQWLRLFGPPRRVLVDLGKEFKREFADLVESDGSELIPSSLETPEQRGLVERHGQLFKDMLCKVMEQHQVSDWEAWHEAVDSVVSIKNRLTSRGGYSPAQRVFGFQQRLPGGLLSDGGEDLAVMSKLSVGDAQVTRSMTMRKLAAQTFHEVECQQAIRAAATHGPRPHFDYQPAHLVFFWRRGADMSRKPANAFWHGPARVVATQLPTTVWLAHNGFLVKAAPEKLRPAAEKEMQSISGWLEGISHARKQLDRGDLRGLLDLSSEDNPDPEVHDADFWRYELGWWVRVHILPRDDLFEPSREVDLPFDVNQDITHTRHTKILLDDGSEHTVDDLWQPGENIAPEVGTSWTGETWFQERPPEGRQVSQPSVQPLRRIAKKARIEDGQEAPSQFIPPGPIIVGVPTLEEPPLPDGAPGGVASSHIEPPPGLGDPAPVEGLPESDHEMDLAPSEPIPTSTSRKRDGDDGSDGWEPLPVAKRSRLELLELFSLAMQPKKEVKKQKKGTEYQVSDFRGKDAERLQKAIHKEVNNNLATGAYKILSLADSQRIRRERPDKIMRSRYVITKKPIEDHELEDMRSADSVLDSSENGPCKAKCRHVMVGFSEESLLEVEMTTPQVHRDTVVYTAQFLVSKGWTPGYADFTQAFHSGGPINRELYSEIPKDAPCSGGSVDSAVEDMLWPDRRSLCLVCAHYQVPG